MYVPPKVEGCVPENLIISSRYYRLELVGLKIIYYHHTYWRQRGAWLWRYGRETPGLISQ